MVSLFLLLGCNLELYCYLFAILHELASASARTLLKLASSVRVLLKPYGDTLSLSIKARNPAQPFIWKWISRLKVIGKGLILILHFSGRIRHLFLDADEGDCDDCWRARLYHYVGEQLRTKGSNISCASCTLQRILIHLHVPLHICHAHRSYEPFGE